MTSSRKWSQRSSATPCSDPRPLTPKLTFPKTTGRLAPVACTTFPGRRSYVSQTMQRRTPTASFTSASTPKLNLILPVKRTPIAPNPSRNLLINVPFLASPPANANSANELVPIS